MPLSTTAIGRKALEIESQRVHASSFEFEEVCKKKARRGDSARPEEGCITKDHRYSPQFFVEKVLRCFIKSFYKKERLKKSLVTQE